jgi:hypothetical protein
VPKVENQSPLPSIGSNYKNKDATIVDYEHMIKVRAHKGGVRIGKTPKKLASICCP